MIHKNTVELLAPAGSPEALEAALAAGADAVYLGAARFSARARAANFNERELASAILSAHRQGARAYLAINTLIGDPEGESALRLIWQAADSGIDALIVQDIGLAYRLRQVLPDLPLHASTQMTIHHEAGLRTLAGLGFRRAILARELSLAEIRRLQDTAAACGLELEVFVHGALCTCFSGQCLLSQLQGGRSGNRGDCAQPCRLSYLCAENTKNMENTKNAGNTLNTLDTNNAEIVEISAEPFPWLSPRDQGLWPHLAALAKAGVRSLKIEGRMRDAAYVRTVVSLYRDLLDGQIDLTDARQAGELKHRLLLAYNRGGSFTDRHLTGRRDQILRAGSISGNQGVLLATVSQVLPGQGQLSLHKVKAFPEDRLPLRGDLLLVRRPGQADALASAPVGSLEKQGDRLIMRGFHPRVLREIRTGDQVYQLGDQRPLPRRPERGKIRLAARIWQNDTEDIVLEGQGLDRLAAGLIRQVSIRPEDRPPLPVERIYSQLAKTGRTPYFFASIKVENPLPLAISSLNQLRRDLLAELEQAMLRQNRRDLPTLRPPAWLPQSVSQDDAQPGPATGLPGLTAYFYRLPENLEDLPCQADRYVLPLLELDEARAGKAVKIISEREPGHACYAWLPAAAVGAQAARLDKAMTRLAEWGLAGCYIGRHSLAQEKLADGIERIHDWGAHLYNQNSLSWLASQNIRHLCPSTELPPQQAYLLARSLPDTVHLEWLLYGRIRAMTLAVCPIGEQAKGCRRCYPDNHDLADTGRPRIIQMQEAGKPALRLLPQPEGCSCDIFSRQIFAADAICLHGLTLQAGKRPYGRLAFLEETAPERRRLVQVLRRVMARAAQDPAGLPDIGDFDQAAASVADRCDSPLEYRRILDEKSTRTS